MKVVVLGAGIIGVSAADQLAQRGSSVTVLDMRSVGGGASQAAAGILAPYTEAHGDRHLLELGVRSLALFDQYVAALTETTGLTIEYARSGTLETAFTETEEARLLDAKRELETLGVSSEWLSAAQCRKFEPSLSPDVVAALYTPSHGLVGIQSLMAAIVHRARFAGVVFESPVEAVAVESRADRVEIRAGERRIEADAVVIATGSWSRRVRVMNVPAIPIRPVRGQLLQVSWGQEVRPRRVVWSSRCYAVPWADGSVLVGATVEDVGFDENPTVAGVQQLMSAALELLPNISSAHVQAVRVGLRPALPDGLPAIGPLMRAPRVIVATGHFRNGVLFAPLTAEVVSRYLVDRVEDEIFAFTSPDRFAALETHP